MKNLMLFKNEEFGQIRTLEIDGKIYAIGNDVAKALGYLKPRNAVTQHCPHALKQGVVSYTTNQHGKTSEQIVEMNIIPEGDIYRLIANSKLPGAVKFERWVFDEVLPSIRKSGGYENGGGFYPGSRAELEQLIKTITTTAVNTAVEVIVAQIPVIVRETVKVMAAAESGPVFTETTEFFNEQIPYQNKVESFPIELRERVDLTLEKMKLEERLNFSRVARMCTYNGYSVTSPTIKKYYDKKFEKE